MSISIKPSFPESVNSSENVNERLKDWQFSIDSILLLWLIESTIVRDLSLLLLLFVVFVKLPTLQSYIT